MEQKTCFKCGYRKARSEFYRHLLMADGLLGKCKECTKQDVRANYAKRRDYYREYERRRFREDPSRLARVKEYAATPAGKVSHAKALKTSRSKWPEKAIARQIVGNSIRDGKIVRQNCVECGSISAEAHHEDYRKPFQITWLCSKHHRMRHGKSR